MLCHEIGQEAQKRQDTQEGQEAEENKKREEGLQRPGVGISVADILFWPRSQKPQLLG